MIKVNRSAEPTELAGARARRGPIAQLHALVSSTHIGEYLTGYDVSPVKITLFADQRKKCAYCERRSDLSSSPVEHFRPKNGAWRNLPDEPRRASRAHYWWLTWTWENLFFACPRCNDQGHKANYFPLEPGSVELSEPAPPLSPSSFDTANERPLLLDPAVDDFLDHVRWVPGNTHLARKLWTWSPTHLTDRGRVTIKILKLEELADDFTSHLVDHVLPRIEEVEQHIKGRRTQQAARCWAKLLELLGPDKDFTAATWCALTHLVEMTWLAESKLPKPSRPR